MLSIFFFLLSIAVTAKPAVTVKALTADASAAFTAYIHCRVASADFADLPHKHPSHSAY